MIRALIRNKKAMEAVKVEPNATTIVTVTLED
jgi:hypothetical protein